MTANEAIRLSASQGVILTLDYDEEDFGELLVQCDDNVYGNGVTEFWGNDPDSEHAMTWRVHMRNE